GCLGVLNTHRRFFLPYAAPAVWNIAGIAALVAAGTWLVAPSLPPTVLLTRLSLALAWGTVAGSVLQVAIQLPACWRVLHGIPVRWSRSTEGVRDVLVAWLPVVLGAGVAQISGLIDTPLGTLAGEGGASSLQYAQLLQVLPISLFGTSVAAVSLPDLSRDAQGSTPNEQLRARIAVGFRRIVFFILPSSLGFVALAPVIVRPLFQTGRFGAADTDLVGGVVAAYGVGLLGQACVKLFQSGFYALRDTKTPVKIASASLVLSSALAYLLVRLRCRAVRTGYLWCSVFRRYHRPAPPRRPSPVDVPALIARQLKALPDKPGVYLWKNAAGEIVYVGKAKSLRARVPSYFGPEGDSTPERAALVRQIAELETIIAPTEAQALLLENNLIKEHKPRFNIRLTDDKSYPRVAVTIMEPFPRVLVVRRVTIPGARYFGPYTDVATLRQTLKIIRRIFTVRSCHWDLPHDTPNRPCLDYHIDRCRAPCVGYQSEADYRRMIDDVLLFLEGKTVDVRTRLRERMQDASQRLDFERAAQLRDALKWLDQVEQPQAVE